MKNYVFIIHLFYYLPTHILRIMRGEYGREFFYTYSLVFETRERDFSCLKKILFNYTKKQNTLIKNTKIKHTGKHTCDYKKIYSYAVTAKGKKYITKNFYINNIRNNQKAKHSF